MYWTKNSFVLFRQVCTNRERRLEEFHQRYPSYYELSNYSKYKALLWLFTVCIYANHRKQTLVRYQSPLCI